MKDTQNLRSLLKKHSDSTVSRDPLYPKHSSQEQSSSFIEKMLQRAKDFVRWIQSPQSKRWKQRAGVITGIVIVLIGSLAVYLTQFTSFDLRQWAWGGAGFSSQQLSRTSSGVGGDDVSLGDPEVAELFTDLTYLYPDADILNVNNDEYGISIIAAKAFDAELQKTLVFIRVENAPYISGTIPKIWLETESGDLIESGVGEYVVEQGVLVAYYITSVEGDGDVYQSLSLTFDEFLDQTTPSPAYFKANFDDEDLEVNL